MNKCDYKNEKINREGERETERLNNKARLSKLDLIKIPTPTLHFLTMWPPF